MQQVKKDLQLDKKPYHIECFDNSNLGGTNPVASCVVFKNGKPSKKDYRQFKIRDIHGPDDFASMEQVIYRRLKRLSEEKEPLPNLIIVDGGKGQLSSGLKSIKKLGFENDIAELLGKKLNIPVVYEFFPQVIGYVRNTLDKKKCDIIIGITASNELVLNTVPYMRWSYGCLLYTSPSPRDQRGSGMPACG